jgi:hypothetical protein
VFKKLLVWIIRKTNPALDQAASINESIAMSQQIVDTVTRVTSYAGRHVEDWDLDAFIDFTNGIQQIGKIKGGTTNGNNSN